MDGGAAGMVLARGEARSEGVEHEAVEPVRHLLRAVLQSERLELAVLRLLARVTMRLRAAGGAGYA